MALGRKDNACPYCGTELQYFLDTCYLGCEHCYEEFAGEISRFIERTQRGAEHTGKRPFHRTEHRKDNYDYLMAELKRAVTTDDYKRATRIKSRIISLREEEDL